MTRKRNMTLHYPKINPHAKFGIPTSKNIEDMHQTRCGFYNEVRGQGHSDTKMEQNTPPSEDTFHTKFGISTSNNLRDMLGHDYSKN